MEVEFSESEKLFREEIATFLHNNTPAHIRRKAECDEIYNKEDYVVFARLLHAKGWATPRWPEKHGGCPWTPVQQYIFTNELDYQNLPAPPPFGLNMLSPVLIEFGSEKQREKYLQRIARLDDWWCQGFSEPGSGSDLASLNTKARRSGDSYIISGQKIWITYAHYADWIFCLVRTSDDPKRQAGISLMLVDMKSKGVTVKPIELLDGGHEVNEVFFDDVAIPLENLVGEENKGWLYAKFLLSRERTGIAEIGKTRGHLDRLKQILKMDPALNRGEIGEKIAAIEIQLKALELSQMRLLTDNALPQASASMLKIIGSQLAQKTSSLYVEAAGNQAGLIAVATEGKNQLYPEWATTAMRKYLNLRKVSIYGGSNEIQKNIIAKSVLQLPG